MAKKRFADFFEAHEIVNQFVHVLVALEVFVNKYLSKDQPLSISGIAGATAELILDGESHLWFGPDRAYCKVTPCFFETK